MSFQHVYLVSVFRCTPDHLSLKYRCPFKMRYRIINIHLRNVEVVMVVVNHNYGFFFIHTCLVRIFVVLVDWKGGGINPEGLIKGNTTWWGVYSPKNNTQISERLPGYQNILRAKLSTILIVIKTIQITRIDTQIFTDNLNSIFLINNHIQHPTSQHHHLDKLLIAAIIHQIYWTPHKVHIHKVRAHSGIIENEIADTLANEGTLKEKPTNTPHIHIAHPTPYWLANYPTTTHDHAIYNLHTFITKEEGNRETISTKNQFPYVDKWLSNTQINQ